MERVAFQLRIRAGREAEYDEAHRHVWPELLSELAAAGVREYSIFRRGQQLFLYMLVPAFDQFLETMAKSEVNERWQQTMALLFEPVPPIEQDERFARMQEVFYMRGSAEMAGSAPGRSGDESAAEISTAPEIGPDAT